MHRQQLLQNWNSTSLILNKLRTPSGSRWENVLFPPAGTLNLFCSLARLVLAAMTIRHDLGTQIDFLCACLARSACHALGPSGFRAERGATGLLLVCGRVVEILHLCVQDSPQKVNQDSVLQRSITLRHKCSTNG